MSQTQTVSPVNKTAEQRKDELFELLESATDAKLTDDILAVSNALSGKELTLGGKVLCTIPDTAPRAFSYKNGQRKGQTGWSIMDNRYSPIVVKVKGVPVVIRISITA